MLFLGFFKFEMKLQIDVSKIHVLVYILSESMIKLTDINKSTVQIRSYILAVMNWKFQTGN